MKVLLVLCLFTWCGFGQTSKDTKAPESLRVPADQKLLLRAQGVGDQIYTCQNGSGTYNWVLKAPDARLLSADHQVVGRHFAGPTWEWKDKSAIVGKVEAKVPSTTTGSVPWLLLSVVVHQGEGAMSGVSTVQRLNTKGGAAPASGCDEAHRDAEIHVAYQADYLFFGK
jgi:hypothetical protein